MLELQTIIKQYNQAYTLFAFLCYFQTKWNVKWNLNLSKGKYRLRCSTKEGRKFLDIIRPIVIQVKCMQYKCLEISLTVETMDDIIIEDNGWYKLMYNPRELYIYITIEYNTDTSVRHLNE